MIRTMNLARDRQLKHLQGHDPINHAPKSTDISDSDIAPKPRFNATYGTMDGVDASSSGGLYQTRPPFGDAFTDTARTVGQGYHRFGKMKALGVEREENLLTHQPKRGAPRDDSAEYGDAIADAAVRYFKTRNFNPLLQRYVDPIKDSMLAAEESAAAARQSQGWYRRMPPLQKVRPTMGFDILSNSVVNPDSAGVVEGIEASRPRSRYYDISGFEERIQTKREGPAELAESRRLATRAHRSYEQHVSRDYDLLSTQARGFEWHDQQGIAGTGVAGRRTWTHEPPVLSKTVARARSAFDRVIAEVE